MLVEVKSMFDETVYPIRRWRSQTASIIEIEATKPYMSLLGLPLTMGVTVLDRKSIKGRS